MPFPCLLLLSIKKLNYNLQPLFLNNQPVEFTVEEDLFCFPNPNFCQNLGEEDILFILKDVEKVYCSIENEKEEEKKKKKEKKKKT